MIHVLLEYGWIGLLFVSIAEASFLPVAPDLLLVPIVGAHHHMALFYALLALGGSLVGAMFGHFLGAKAGYPILRKFMSEDRLNQVRSMFDRYGIWAVVVAGLIPLPFKLFTISAGVFKMRRRTLLTGALIGRGIRFGLVAWLSTLFNIKIPHGLETKFLLGLLVVVGLVVLYLYIKSEKGRWLRDPLLNLVQFFKHDFLTPIRKGSRPGLVVLAIGTMCSLLVAVFGGDRVADFLYTFDGPVHHYVIETLQPRFDFEVKMINWLFSMPVVITGYLFVAYRLLFTLRKLPKMRLFAGLLLGTMLMQFLFKSFEWNPLTEFDVDLNAFDKLLGMNALPSGRVMAAILLYTSLAYLTWVTIRTLWVRLLGIATSMLLILCAPLSHILFGHHRMSSALGGLVAAILWILGCICTWLVWRYVEQQRSSLSREL
ncbi:YqaA family protein [Tumebacillus permanentifrigoris]|uniref:Membrane protein YqaA with SNARE-associated domain n=1 Tax=Tumebacillus permanentifrigoris TaxID=378543 RepID=A0A316DQR3_9BACL|nr:VTT domain-containing protein [Tumebacillus permanentifrigoris]PWK05982.1 membrane protein YqaA with SNARE-associated domain [Tumebacillus permanentifrigoris]